MTPPVVLLCPACKKKDTVPGTDVRLVACDHGTRVVWPCPTCTGYVWITATADQIKLLAAAGIVPLQVAYDVGTGPAITEDDLIAFGLEMEATP